ncbi:hypothetical protein FN846DRAFT_886795 [Sphaerosporella brunnea]|uniref:DUF6589 domain-containing protein n=1 Tax=Sphaerosporella brunnea TaxID=1250544 RepID=A0A5J5F7I4_9PEZI|nr:hypothetical protein FN846DRAFT_886795 [Sphaerosporella brunnea]
MPTTRGIASCITGQSEQSNPVQPGTPIEESRHHSRGAQPGPPGLTPLLYLDSEARRMRFSSLAQAVLHQVSESSDLDHSALKDYTALLTTIVAQKKFNATIASYNKRFMRGVTQLLTDHSMKELDVLVAKPESRFNMKRFTPEHIESFNPTLLQSAHQRYTPTLHAILHGILHKDNSRPAQDDSRRKQRPYDRDLVATAAICMLSYARHRESNGLQALVGYFLFASNTSKRTIEVLHRFGLSVSYETILKALRHNAEASRDQLRRVVKEGRFMISFDNMNFYRNVRDQRAHNRSHQVNYTAGFICVMDCDCGSGPDCECGALPERSIDHMAASLLSFKDFDIDSDAQMYLHNAADYLFGTVLKRHFASAMSKQKDPETRGPRYSVPDPPLAHIRVKQDRARILTFQTLDMDEASISGTIDILKALVQELGIDCEDVLDRKIMLHGDYLTVRNVTRAMFRRSVEPEPLMRFGWVEPIAGLFHLQMNVLKLIFGVFEGEAADPGSLKRFSTILRRKGVSKDIKDFHACDDFFRMVLEAYILAYYQHYAGLAYANQLNAHLETSDWPAQIALAVRAGIDPFMVSRVRSVARESIDAAVGVRMEEERAKWEVLKAQRRLQRQNGQSLANLPRKDWKNIQSRLTADLGAGIRDIVKENAMLFLNCGLIYLDFHDACRGGFSGRVERCVKMFAILFAGGKHGNYAGECIHLVACLARMWKPEFKQAWLDYCLINPNSRPDIYCAIDRHGETVIRENKDKVRPSANAKDDRFLREVVARNVGSLRASKHVMAECTGATDYRNRHTEVSRTEDISLIRKKLVEAHVFTHVPGRGSDSHPAGRLKEYEDIIGSGYCAMASGIPISKYLARARFTWDSELPQEDDADLVEEAELDDGEPGCGVYSTGQRLDEPGFNEIDDSEDEL